MSRNLVTSSLLSAAALIALGAAGCSEPPTDGPPEGYRRFETAPIPLPAGASGQWVQYVSEPLTEDLDIVDIIGEQGPGGHHAILYATPTVEPIGTTRDWRSIDQIADRFLGGVGGEGAEEIRLPEGAVFRIPKGSALYVNTHYINASDQDELGTSRLDVKLAPASPSRRAVGLFANIDIEFTLPPDHAVERTTTCTIGSDLDVVMFANHMHNYGVATRTTSTPPGGAPTVLKDDPTWSPEWTANPNFAREDVAAPLRLARGTTISTECSWVNTSAHDLTFPDEMCLFLGFHLGGHDVSCVNGTWAE